MSEVRPLEAEDIPAAQPEPQWTPRPRTESEEELLQDFFPEVIAAEAAPAANSVPQPSFSKRRRTDVATQTEQ